MNVRSRRCLASCLLAAGAWPAPAGARTKTAPETYIVTTITASGVGNIVVQEALSLERSGGESRLEVAHADGSVVSVPVTFTPQGQVATSSQDVAITCYNMAMGVLDRTRKAAGEPASVFVRFANSIVRIPLDVRSTTTRGSVRELELEGRSAGTFSAGDATADAGIIISAAVEEADGDLHGATFDERNYVDTPAHVVSRSICTLQRGKLSGTTRV